MDTTKVFDFVLRDFFFIYKILDVGGIVIFEDATEPGINLVMRFINSLPHCQIFDKYEQLQLSKKYKIGGRIFEKIIGAITFKKIEIAERNWN